ncbi:MAG TPA: cobyrinic acid a,c-diamide synthase, partial [bacterium]|nr:cobyrinic acid a,c-diamide synthase [bacterium]
VDLKTTQDSLLGPKGTVARGHEFHHSRITSDRFKGKPLYDCVTSTGRSYTEGFQFGNLLASYVHLHFKSNPRIAAAFIQKCKEYQTK